MPSSWTWKNTETNDELQNRRYSLVITGPKKAGRSILQAVAINFVDKLLEAGDLPLDPVSILVGARTSES